MKKTLVTLIICLIATSSFAKTVNRKTSAAAARTNNMFVPLMRQHEVVFAAVTPFGNIDAGPIGSKTELSGFNLRAGYGYGLADFIAIYAIQQYTSLDYSYSNPKSSGKTTGVGDTTFGVKGILNFDKPFFYYDASYTMALADKYSYNSVSRESTAVSSRSNMSFEGGAGMPVGQFGIGGLVGYHLYQDGEATTKTYGVTTTTQERAGTGLDWKVYGQLEMNWKLGVSYQENKTDEYNLVNSGISSIRAASTNTYITVYGIIPVMSAGEVILSAAKLDNKEATTTTYNLYYLTATLRWIL